VGRAGPVLNSDEWVQCLDEIANGGVVPSVDLAKAARGPSGASAVIGILGRSLLGVADGCADEADIVPNIAHPFVEDGGGAPRGLSPSEHVAWAAGQTPEHNPRFISPDLIRAVHREVIASVEELDAERQSVVDCWRAKAAELQYQRKVIDAEADLRIRPLVRKLHVPFIRWLVDVIDYPDKDLPRCCAQGFPFAGKFGPCKVDVQTARPPPVKDGTTVESLRRDRAQWNQLVMDALKPMPRSEEVHRAAVDDAEEGYMSFPVELKRQHLIDGSLSRRLPVVESKVNDHGDWIERVRTVDHCTESGVNGAAEPVDKLRHESIDDLVWVICQLQEVLKQPRLWKRDLRKAFRGVPICADQLDLSWVVWMSMDKTWVSQHFGMPFGTTSAVYGFHRLGGFLGAVVKSMARASLMRYVDDYFGASPKGVYWTGGRLLDVLTELVGRPVDPKKSVDDATEIVILGAQLVLEPDQRGVRSSIQEIKAIAWVRLIDEAIHENRLDGGSASKMAGRLSFAVTAAANRCGRAFVKPIYAQAVCPFGLGGMSPWLRAAMRWWRAYLVERPTTVRRIDQKRKQYRLFTDAAGECPHVAAVLDGEGMRKYTHSVPPQWFMDQLLVRGDHNIGVLEAVAVVLGLSTFANELEHADVLVFVDNQGVLHSLMNASSRQPETNAMVGEIWLRAACKSMSFYFWRVESHANIADGPTRQFYDDMVRLGCLEVEPKWPQFLEDLWASLGVARAW